MRKNLLTLCLIQAIAAAQGGLPGNAAAQEAPGPTDAETPRKPATDIATVEVVGDIVYRDRSDEIAPTLVYDLEYFQRFEPLTVGDMLKRVPSVAFVSDVLEYDGARLRGLDPGYTQVLINGKKVPGAGDDRSFFVDRIPAELVERIEIVRSPSANRSGDALAGALNIVLRDAYKFDGTYLRAGGMHYDDGKFRGVVGAVGGGEFAGGRLVAGFNVQGRHNPKVKRSDRFEEPGGDFSDREDQSDVRDGTDYSLNASYSREVGTGRLSLSGLYVRTDRSEKEHSLEYNDPQSTSRGNLLSVNDQLEDIDQDNFALTAGYRFDMLGGRTDIDLSWARFDEEVVSTEEETGYDDDDDPPSFDELEGAREITDRTDDEFSLSLSHERELGEAKMEFGVDYNDKRRDARLAVSEVDTDVEGEPLPPYDDFDVTSSRIEERRLDPYLMFSGRGASFEWEAGLRYETTDVEIDADGAAVSNDYSTLLPSLHLRWNLGERDRFSLSLARTVRRPSFNQILPVTLEEEFGDNDFAGNPLLKPETAWGVDLGFEHRIGRYGIVGVNVFYRDVSDLIEIVNTGAPSATALDDYDDEVEEFLDENPGADENTPGYPEFDPDSFVYSAANVGDGRVWGVEIDLSTPLTAWGMPDTGVFLNYSWLDSAVDDEFGERRFNDQARSVLNVGFIQDLPSIDAAFGASYRRQGDAFSRLLAEEVGTRYGGDLEVFVEKRFGKDVSIRFTGSNLLNASKREAFNKFDNAADQRDRDFDEYELESEKAGPVYQVIVRYAF